MKEKNVINSENFENVKQLLKSKDPESRIMGWLVVEHSDFEESIGYILMLIKEIFDTSFTNESYVHTTIKDESGKLYDNLKLFLKKHNIESITRLSWKTIHLIIKNRNNKEEEAFFYERMTQQLSSVLHMYGIDIANEFEITIKLKNNE